jgi:hypothetical protein
MFVFSHSQEPSDLPLFLIQFPGPAKLSQSARELDEGDPAFLCREAKTPRLLFRQ